MCCSSAVATIAYRSTKSATAAVRPYSIPLQLCFTIILISAEAIVRVGANKTINSAQHHDTVLLVVDIRALSLLHSQHCINSPRVASQMLIVNTQWSFFSAHYHTSSPLSSCDDPLQQQSL
jgi:hypothetical protein